MFSSIHYSARVGDTVLELYPQRGAETRGLRLGFLVSDLAAVLRLVERNGGKVVRAAPVRGKSRLGDSFPFNRLSDAF